MPHAAAADCLGCVDAGFEPLGSCPVFRILQRRCVFRCDSRWSLAVVLAEAPGREDGMTESSELVYQAVAARRLQWDNLLWQVPTLSLTAQAFLFTIALGPDSKLTARVVSCALSLIVTFLSVTLMARYRQGELSDAHWLEAYELEHGLTVVHGKQFKADRDNGDLAAGWVGRMIPILPGFVTWVIGLGLFGLAAIAILLLSFFVPGALDGSGALIPPPLPSPAPTP